MKLIQFRFYSEPTCVPDAGTIAYASANVTCIEPFPATTGVLITGVNTCFDAGGTKIEIYDGNGNKNVSYSEVGTTTTSLQLQLAATALNKDWWTRFLVKRSPIA